MTTLSCRVATTLRHLDDALNVRYAVFGSELGLLGGSALAAPREVNCFDTLETTSHVVVYADEVPVATTRLLLPNQEVARATGGRWGLALEDKVDLSSVGGTGLLFAESTRLCILHPWRHSEALLWLLAGLYWESRRRGVTHWIASANMETDCGEDARLIHQVAKHKGWLSQRWHVPNHPSPPPPETPLVPLYSEWERAGARRGQLDGLRMPGVLSFFARKMGARFISEPIYDPAFQRYSLPLVAALNEIPASTLRRFDALSVPAARGA
ncbi:GNAT family N-acyltransferase [Melittangium boletus]|uniref:GNAT family N-acetyltransferase n=1 Tax=Melittangium boletus DSM 14713 TaxID=1294270 RepID=A0A250IRS0_9BACT|nr:GNAT family N-acyltransferase [Melittangium boletus]ATB34439.1 hypothetical protein MEBOL_007942 [Melittangium boletus DSM 14713]